MYKNLLLLLLLPFCAQAQQPAPYTWLFDLPQKVKYSDYIRLEAKKYFELEVDDRVGIYSMEGRWAIEPKYADIYLFAGMPMPFQQERGGKWGLMDIKGNVILQPSFDELSYFSEGLCAATLDGKIGFINKKGKLLIPHQYNMPKYQSARFRKKVCWVQQGDKWGLIDPKGRWLLQPKFDEITAYRSLPDWVCQDSLWGYMGKDKQWIIAPKFKHSGSLPYIQTPRKGSPCVIIHDGKWGTIDYAGNWLIQPQFDDINPFQNGWAFAREGKLWGIINEQGKWIVAPKFEDDEWGFGLFQYEPSTGLALAIENQLYGFIDSLGNWKVPARYLDISNLYGPGWTAKNEDYQWGILDAQGQPLAGSFQYSKFRYFSQDYILAQKEGYWGIITHNNQTVIPFIFSEFNDLNDDYALVELNGKLGVIKLALPKPKKKTKG